MCTKIDVHEIIEEMNKSKPINKSSMNRLRKKKQNKKFATALELLTRFNRR